MNPNSTTTTPRPLPSLLADISASVNRSLSIPSTPPLFSSLLEQLNPILDSLHYTRFSDYNAIFSALESLESQLARANSLIRSPGGSSRCLIERSVREIGCCLGLVIDAWVDAPIEVKEGAELLKKEMTMVKFEVPEKKIASSVTDIDDLMVRVKTGDEEGLGRVISEIEGLIEEKILVGEECGGLISALFGRLCSVKSENRVKIISLLRRIAVHSNENKEKMASVEALSSIVRSLSRDETQRREAVGLLLDISDISKVRQRIGKIKGCIVMLVALNSGDDPCAKNNAGNLLNILSSNTQNVLLMAEAGYFLPLIHHLKEGSDMNKILIASAISKMHLSEQMKNTLGDEGVIEPLVKIFTSGNLEAKSSALCAIRNLSSSTQNIKILLDSGIISPLFQLLFSVTSVLMTLREPASALLETLARSETILKYKGVPEKALSLLNLSCPVIQLHLLSALNSITGHSNGKRARAKVRENGAMQLLLPFLSNTNEPIRNASLNLMFNLSKDFMQESTERFVEQTHLNLLVKIVSSALTSENEKAAAIGIISNLPAKDKKVTEFLIKSNFLPLLVTLLVTGMSNKFLVESISGVFIRFTVPWDMKLQNLAVANGVISCLLKVLLSDGSIVAKSRTAVSLGQLSQNSLSLSKSRSSRVLCLYPSSETYCEVHGSNCTVKSTFCLVKSGAVPPLIRVLEEKERDADENVLEALSTLMQDETWESGSKVIESSSGVEAILRVVELGNSEAQEKAIWMLERLFRIDFVREKYGELAQVLLIDLTQKGESNLRPMIGKILAHLDLLQMQSSYF